MQVESLETRRLLAFLAPSNLDQYVIELVNRARANPVAEAARFGIDLNEGLPPGTISSAAKQPVAVNPNLTDAIHAHAQWIFATGQFGHAGAGGSSPEQRIAAAGYPLTGLWSAAENLALAGGSFAPNPLTAATTLHQGLFTDQSIEGRWHRRTMLSETSREIGAAVRSGVYTGFNSVIVGQDFASNTSNPLGDTFITGVVYTDAVTHDNFYTVGEGLGGVNLQARRITDAATFAAATYGSGGYSIRLSPGTYDVTASGPGFSTAQTRRVVVGNQNIKVDVVPGADAEPPVVLGSAFEFETLPYRLTLSFSENVAASLAVLDLTIQNALTGAPITVTSMTYNSSTNQATFTFNGPLSDGDYRAILRAGTVQDPAGNSLAADVAFDFFVLAGDANRDGSIDITDFSRLSANFNQSPRTFSQGDFDYSGGVNLADFAILASRFNTSLPAAAGSEQTIDEDRLFDDLLV